MVKELIEKTTTKTGLKVTESIMYRVYEKGKKVTKKIKESIKIIFDEYLGSWNYRAVPMKS